MKDIYSDIWAEVLTTELGEKRIQIYDREATSRNPTLVIPNLVAVKNLRNYLNDIIKDNKKYFKE